MPSIIASVSGVAPSIVKDPIYVSALTTLAHALAALNNPPLDQLIELIQQSPKLPPSLPADLIQPLIRKPHVRYSGAFDSRGLAMLQTLLSYVQHATTDASDSHHTEFVLSHCLAHFVALPFYEHPEMSNFTLNMTTALTQIAQSHSAFAPRIVSLIHAELSAVQAACNFPVLIGVLTTLGDTALPHTPQSAMELYTILYAILTAPSLPQQPHTLALRALTVLLQSYPHSLKAEQWKTLFERQCSVSQLPLSGSSTIKSSPYTTLTVTHQIRLATLCAVNNSELQSAALQKLKELLNQCLMTRSSHDNSNSIMIIHGCVDIIRTIMNGMVTLVKAYPSELLTSSIDIIKTILLQSKRLHTHPKQQQLQVALTEALCQLFTFELTRLPYDVSTTRSIVASLTTSLYKEDTDDATNAAGGSAKSHQTTMPLVLLMDIISSVRTEAMVSAVLPLIVARFNGRPKHLYLIVPQLSELAIHSSQSHMDSIITLFINTYMIKPNQLSSLLNDDVDDVTNAQSVLTLPNKRSAAMGTLINQQANSMTARTENNHILPNANSAVGSGGTDLVSLKQNAIAIPAAFLRLAHSTLDAEARKLLLKRMMRLFVELAMNILSSGQGNNEWTAKAPICGFILPTIAALLQPLALPTTTTASLTQLTVDSSNGRANGPSASTTSASSIGASVFDTAESNVKWFRRFWFFLTLFGFTQPKQYRYSEWFDAVLIISRYSPVLLVSDKRDYLLMDLQMESARYKMNGALIKSMQNYAIKLMPQLNATILTLSSSQLMYVLAVYHCETIRVKNPPFTNTVPYSGFAPIFAYIVDEDIRASVLLPCVVAIAEAVYSHMLDTVFSSDNAGHQSLAIDCILFLLHKVLSRYASERTLAQTFLKKITVKYPYYQWNSACLSQLLSLLHVVHQSCDMSVALSHSVTVAVNHNNTLEHHNTIPQLSSTYAQLSASTLSVSALTANRQYFELSESLNTRASIQLVLSDLAVSWLNNAYYLVGARVNDVLEEYIRRIDPLQLNHVGLGLALKASHNDNTFSPLVTHLSFKQTYLGRISGLYENFLLQNKSAMEKANKHHMFSHGAFAHALTVSLIQSSNHLLNEGRSLYCPACHPPQKSSTSSAPSSQSTSSFVSAYHSKFSELMYTMSALLVWINTNDHRRQDKTSGIDSDSQQLLHLLCVSPAVVFDEVTMAHSVMCWRWVMSVCEWSHVPLMIEMRATWTVTIDRHYGLFGNDGPNCLHHTQVRTHTTVAPHNIWINFLTTYFTQHSAPVRSITTILTSMLHKAFSNADIINDQSNSFASRFRLLNLGFVLLHANRSSRPALQSSSAPSTTPSTQVRIQRSRDEHLLRERMYSVGLAWFYGEPIWYDTLSTSKLKDDVAVLVNFCKALSSEDGYWNGIDDAVKAKLHSKRNLLLFLLSHELDRISIWHNPHKMTALQFNDAQLFTTQRAVPISANEWRSMLQTAWKLDARLAVRFAQRFAQYEIVRTELCALIQSQPNAVYHVPESVVFLVTEDTVKRNAWELRSLIYFQPCSIPIALSFLQPPYCHHRLVLEYAVHTLRSHPVEDVVFFLTQIIQSLRNDSHELIHTFLLRSASTSILLSHQLIWLCQAELGEVKASDRPLEMTPFRLQCQEVLNGILSNFTPNERQFYLDEFSFFEQITAISGILKPLPTKQARKAKIKSELEKVTVPAGLYLPTNSILRVCEIICSSGTPLKSAAKVPILVVFMVREDPMNEDDIRRGIRDTPGKVKQLTADEDKAAEDANGVIGDDMFDGIDTRVSTPSSKVQELRFTTDADDGSIETVTIAPTVNGTKETPKAVTTTTVTVTAKSANSETVSTYTTSTVQKTLFPTACIFKVGDDCRQDSLALQVIQWCKAIFERYHLPLYLYPYRVLPNRTGAEGLIGGIIECVPSAQTRDEIGKTFGGSLKQYFYLKYGREESTEYQNAVRAFIVSLAGYAVTSYLLQVKDRHNGNLMIDEAGHVVHIDFGFIFDISPAKDLKFESAAFKLTTEMVELMGGDTTSANYHWFELLVVRGFLAVRQHAHELIAMVQPMLQSTLTCFKPNSLQNLISRLALGRDERGACEDMLLLIKDANSNWRTNTYDWIQNMQQDVYYYQTGKGEE